MWQFTMHCHLRPPVTPVILGFNETHINSTIPQRPQTINP